MNQVPKDLLYTASHEWIRKEGSDIIVVGITDHAQSQLGELVFVDLPEVDASIHAFDEICVVESVKAASDVYAPLSGQIIEINEDLEESPSLVNSDPYGDGWLFKIKISDDGEFKDLLDSDAYLEQVEAEEEA